MMSWCIVGRHLFAAKKQLVLCTVSVKVLLKKVLIDCTV